MTRRAASTLAVLAAVAFGCSSGADDIGGEPARSSVEPVVAPAPPIEVDQGYGPRELLDGVEWPPALVLVELSDTANDQLLITITGEPRLAPFVVDVAAVGLGEGRRNVATVLAVQLVPEAAGDPTFRASVIEALTGDREVGRLDTFVGQGIAGSWQESALVVAIADDQDVLVSVMNALANTSR